MISVTLVSNKWFMSNDYNALIKKNGEFLKMENLQSSIPYIKLISNPLLSVFHHLPPYKTFYSPILTVISYLQSFIS